MAETCGECGRFTREGEEKRQAYYKANPIFGTDLSKPLSETIEGLRRKIAEIRGSLSDIGFAYPGWGERLKEVEGALTCCLVCLHNTREEMKAVEQDSASVGGSSA